MRFLKKIIFGEEISLFLCYSRRLVFDIYIK